MAKMTPVRHIYNAPPTGDFPADSSTGEAKVEFARRLQQRMRAKGFTQTDLANRASERMPGDAVIGKDSISLYIRGKSFPGPTRVQALADALGTTAEELIPTRGVKTAEGAHPSVAVKEAEDGQAWIRINKKVKWTTAVKVLELLKTEENS